jgi:hypothetical protein
MLRRLTYFARKEIIMASRTTRHYVGLHNVAGVAKATMAVAGLAALGYIAVAVVGPVAHSLSSASGFGVELQTANLEAATETTDAAAAAGEPADIRFAGSKPALVIPDFDYFPDRVMHHATKTGEPTPTL